MAEFVSNKKIIAKNTMFLYIRMILVTAISLYTSRVILQTLGASDYGVYNVVGGVVLLMTFINGPLNAATVRFLTYELGRQDRKQLSNTFAASLNLHLSAGLLAIIVGETIGLWFLYNKLVIPDDRMNVAFWVFQFSLLNCFFDFTQVPFTASINAHEKMSVYAYIGLYEAASKLLIAYLIAVSPWDRLFFYALLLMINKIGVQLFCRYYTRRHYEECRFRLFWDKELYKKLATYAGWDTFGGVASVCENQGISILLNLFFGPVVNAARAISIQVQSAITMFVNNMMSAVRPQIVKNYAVGNYKEMYNLTFSSTRYTFYMMLFLVLPIIFELKMVLSIWLGADIPNYTLIFTFLILIIAMVNAVDYNFLMAFHAIGNIKLGNIVGGGLMIAALPISYLCLKKGMEPYSVFIVIIIINIAETIFDFFLTRYLVHFSVRSFIKNTLVPIIIVTFLSILTPLFIVYVMPPSMGRFILNIVFTEIALVIIVWFFGLKTNERLIIVSFIKSKIKR